MNPSTRLSPHFTLGEMLHSQVAERDEALAALQHDPPPEVVESLGYLCRVALEPVRGLIGAPVFVSSGYRSRQLNSRIGGSRTSQHCLGEAADLHPGHVPPGRRADILQQVLDEYGLDLDAGMVSDAGMLFLAVAAMHLNRLDVDQVIHEFGTAMLRPAWVHVAASRRQSRRRVTVVGDLTGGRYQDVHLVDALSTWGPVVRRNGG